MVEAAAKPLSREEQLRRWQERRAQQPKSGGGGGGGGGGVSRRPKSPASDARKVKVKVRRSHPTMENNNKSGALRLHERGTVASRLKAKAPAPHCSNPTTFAPKPKEYPSTLPRGRKPNFLNEETEERRRSEPSNHVLRERRILSEQLKSAHRRSSSICLEESPGKPLYSPVIEEDSTNMLILRHEEGESAAVSPLSCSCRSSLFGSPPRHPSSHFRNSHGFDHLEPTNLHDDIHRGYESLSKHSSSLIDKYSPADLQHEASYNDYGAKFDKYEILVEQEEVAMETSQELDNVTTRSQRSITVQSFSSLSDDAGNWWEDWSDSRIPGGIVLPPSPSQRQWDDEKENHCEAKASHSKLFPLHHDSIDKRNDDQASSENSIEPNRNDTQADEEKDMNDGDSSFDWRDNLSPDLPSQRGSFKTTSKRRRDVPLLLLPAHVSSRTDIRRRTCSPTCDPPLIQSPLSSSLRSDPDELDRSDGLEDKRHKRSLSLDPSASIQSTGSLGDEVNFTQDVDLDSRGTMEPHIENAAGDEDIDDDAEPLVTSADTFVQVDGKTILRPIREYQSPLAHPTATEEPDRCCCRCCISRETLVDDLRNQIGDLQWRAETAETEKQKYQNQIFAMRKQYDTRITPFRDLFEEVRRLYY